MKQILLSLLLLSGTYFSYGQNSKSDLTGKIGITLYGGPSIPSDGNYSTGLKTSDVLKTGTQFTLGVSYFITKGLGIEGSLGAGYNYYRQQYKPNGKDPLWVNLSASVNAIYNFAHMFRKPVVSPFIRIGAGSYQWEHLEDGLFGGNVTKDNNNHKINSFGFTVGAGAEYLLKKNLAIGVMVDYERFFPKSEEVNTVTNSVATERVGHGYLVPQLKLTYYIPTRKK